jgi:hypothetical protein
MNAPLIKRIDFKYNNLMHSALVSMSGTSEVMFVHVQLINSFLQKIFGIEHIRFLNRNGQIQLKEGKHPAVRYIADFITKELEQLSDIETSSELRIV